MESAPHSEERRRSNGGLVDTDGKVSYSRMLVVFLCATVAGVVTYALYSKKGTPGVPAPSFAAREGAFGSSELGADGMSSLRPRSDARSYATTVLPNGLAVLAIQDTQSLQAAVSVGVQVGSMDDPENLPGLFHFCEHMLFLGTQKYPDPNGLRTFLDNNGGNSNAFTAEEATVYYMQLSNSAFPELLDRVADMFRDPLFASSFVEKEVHAIDSEHQKNVQDPNARFFAVLADVADPRSPASRFHTGSVQTLMKNNGTETVAALRDEFDKHYCPPKMKLVTLSSDAPDAQMKRIQDTFGTISQGGRSRSCASLPPTTHEQPAPYPSERLRKWVDIQGVSPHSSMWLTFPFPDQRAAYPSQPFDYINWMFNYEGEGSLFHVLRDGLGLAYKISAGGDDSSTAGTMFSVMIVLTDRGRSQKQLLIDVIFAYLGLLRLRGIDEALLVSLANSSRLSWDWAEPTDPISTVSTLAERLTRMPRTDVLWGDSVNRQPDPKLVASLMKGLTPSRMNVFFIDPKAQNETGFNENVREVPNFGVKYRSRQIEDVMPGAPARWENWLSNMTTEEELNQVFEARGSTEKVTENPALPQAPRALKDLPLNASIKYSLETGAAFVVRTEDEKLFGPQPRKLTVEMPEVQATATTRNTTSAPTLWYRRGWTSNAPKGSARFAIKTIFRPKRPKGGEPTSARDAVRTALFDKLLDEEMTPHVADIVAAGGEYSIDVGSEGLSLSFGGLEPVRASLVEKVLQEARLRLKLDTAGTRFERVLSLFKRELASYTEMPIKYAIADRNLILTHGEHSKKELLEVLKDVTVDTAKSSLSQVLFNHPLECVALAMGNVNESQAQSTVRAIVDSVASSTVGDAARAERDSAGGEVESVTPVVNPGRPVEIRALNPRPGDPNHAIVVSIINGVNTVESRVLFGIIGEILGTVAFDTLRTDMQLGYVVNGGAVQISNVQLLSIVVQGTVLHADELEAAVQHVFVKAMTERLQNLSSDELESQKGAFAEALKQKPFHTSDEVSQFWNPIATDSRCFSLHQAMLDYANRTLSSKDVLVDAWKKLVTPWATSNASDAPMRKVVMVKYFPGDVVPPRPTEDAAAAAWERQGVPKDAIDALRREHRQALVLSRADSQTRQQVLDTGGAYFPLDLNCGPRGGQDTMGYDDAKALMSLLTVDVDAVPEAIAAPARRKKRADSQLDAGGVFLRRRVE